MAFLVEIPVTRCGGLSHKEPRRQNQTSDQGSETCHGVGEGENNRARPILYSTSLAVWQLTSNEADNWEHGSTPLCLATIEPSQEAGAVQYSISGRLKS